MPDVINYFKLSDYQGEKGTFNLPKETYNKSSLLKAGESEYHGMSTVSGLKNTEVVAWKKIIEESFKDEVITKTQLVNFINQLDINGKDKGIIQIGGDLSLRQGNLTGFKLITLNPFIYKAEGVKTFALYSCGEMSKSYRHNLSPFSLSWLDTLTHVNIRDLDRGYETLPKYLYHLKNLEVLKVDISGEKETAFHAGMTALKELDIHGFYWMPLKDVLSLPALQKLSTNLKYKKLSKESVEVLQLLQEKGVELSVDIDIPKKEIKEYSFVEATNYRMGINGYPKNIDKAFKIYENLFNEGDARAAFALGQIYSDNDFVETDQKKAAYYHLQAANAGIGFAEHEMGARYFNGTGVEINYSEAYKYTSLAHKKDIYGATINLATLYLEGKGVEKDAKKAKKLCLKVTTLSKEPKELDPAYKLLALIYYLRGDSVKRNFKRAIQFCDLISNENRKPYDLLGHCYRDGGYGLDIDLEKATEYYQKGALLKNPNCLNSLAAFYLEGRGGLEKNPGEALKLLEEATKLGCYHAFCNLGDYYSTGRIEPNPQLSLEYYKKFLESAEDSEIEPRIFYNMGVAYSLLDKKQDAFNFTQKAYEREFLLAAYNLGIYYYHGHGVEQDRLKACDLFIEAAMQGDEKAKEVLGVMKSTEEDPIVRQRLMLYYKKETPFKKVPKKLNVSVISNVKSDQKITVKNVNITGINFN